MKKQSKAFIDLMKYLDNEIKIERRKNAQLQKKRLKQKQEWEKNNTCQQCGVKTGGVIGLKNKLVKAEIVTGTCQYCKFFNKIMNR